MVKIQFWFLNMVKYFYLTVICRLHWWDPAASSAFFTDFCMTITMYHYTIMFVFDNYNVPLHQHVCYCKCFIFIRYPSPVKFYYYYTKLMCYKTAPHKKIIHYYCCHALIPTIRSLAQISTHDLKNKDQYW